MTILRDLSIYWSMIHVIFLFLMLFRSRYTRKITILAAGAGMTVLMMLNAMILVFYGFDMLSKVFLFTCSIPSFIFFYIMSADKRFRFLLTFCLADTSCMWIMAVTAILDHYLGGSYVFMFISRLIAFPLIEYCVYRFLRRPYLELQNSVKNGWGIFAVMTVIYYVLLAVIVQYPVNIVNRPQEMLSCVLVLLLMFFTYGTIFTALYRQHLLYKRQQNEAVLQEQKHMLEMQLENQQHIRKVKHDMKAHAATISGLLATGKTKEALKYLAQIQTELDTLSGAFCGNPYINAVFVRYYQRFQELSAKIRFDIQIGDEELPYMDLCRICSNGLENAENALKELDEGVREVSAQMKYNKDYLVIRIKNRCSSDLYVEKGTIPDTDKEGRDHGFGLPAVKESAMRLGGDMLCYTEDERFVLDVMVKVKCSI